MVDSSEFQMRSENAMPILSTLIYCLDKGRVLLMRRSKEPNLGLWVAPGGKVEAGESPYDCAVRELYEETGLRAERIRFRGLITEISPQPNWQWMLFLYVATDLSGELNGDQREGEFKWWILDEVYRLDMPQSDKVFMHSIIDFTRPFYDAKFIYNIELDLIEVIEQG